MAADLFVVPTVTFRLLFVLVILGHDCRRIIHAAVTDDPTAAWNPAAPQRLPRRRGTGSIRAPGRPLTAASALVYVRVGAPQRIQSYSAHSAALGCLGFGRLGYPPVILG